MVRHELGGRRHRVLILVGNLDIGGAQRQTLEFATALAEAGDEVLLLVRKHVQRHVGGIRGLTVAQLTPGRQLLDCLRFVFEFGPTIAYGVSADNCLRLLVSRMLGRRRPVLVWSLRSSRRAWEDMSSKERLALRLARRLSLLADSIICNSRAGLSYYRELGFSAQRLAYVPNGVRVDYFQFSQDGREQVRHDLGLSQNAPVLGYVGRLHPLKRLEHLITATEHLRERHPDVTLMLIGEAVDPAYENALRRLVAAKKLDERVLFLGQRHDLSALYSAMDIFCLPSKVEGASNALLEAMACRRIPVATDVGDTRTIVGDTGYVVAGSDVQALADACEQVLALDAATRDRLGRRARARVSGAYSRELLRARTMQAIVGER